MSWLHLEDLHLKDFKFSRHFTTILFYKLRDGLNYLKTSDTQKKNIIIGNNRIVFNSDEIFENSTFIEI